jgi:hypothetical protein
MKSLATEDLEQAKLDPASVFRAPEDVVRALHLSPEQKKTILVRWEADAEALMRATEEGMSPSDARSSADARSPGELLRALHEAIESLNVSGPVRHAS